MKKLVSVGEEEGKKVEVELWGEGEDDIWRGLSLSPRHVIRVFVCFWGNNSDRGGVI